MGEDNENINICRKIERRDKSVMGRSFGLSGQGRLLRGGESSGKIRMTRNQDQREFCMKGATCAKALGWELCPLDKRKVLRGNGSGEDCGGIKTRDDRDCRTGPGPSVGRKANKRF